MSKCGLQHILLVDIHPEIRHALALMLAEEGVGHCREVTGREQALSLADINRPDIALVDLPRSAEEAFKLIRELHARGIPVLACSMYEAPGRVHRAFAAGARGYITKREAPLELAITVRHIVAGWMLISPRAAEGIGPNHTQAPSWTAAPKTMAAATSSGPYAMP